MLVGCGILTYYFAPSAFLFQDFGMFFGIMNLILMIMILGMSYLVILILPSLQKLMLGLFLCCCRRDRKLKQIILKNFESHRSRNLKTALMFSVALSFVVFASASFHLIGKMIISTLEASLGSDLFAMSTDTSLTNMIDEGAISTFLQVQKDHYSDISGWSYKSQELYNVLKACGLNFKPQLLTVSGTIGSYIHLYSVSENFLDVNKIEYFIGTEIEDVLKEVTPKLPDGNYDYIRGLYSDYGIDTNQTGSLDPLNVQYNNWPNLMYQKNYTSPIKLLAEEGIRLPYSLSTSTPLVLQIGSSGQSSFLVKPREIASKIPGFPFFTAYQEAQFMMEGIVT